jgi:YD repeat-containing protein
VNLSSLSIKRLSRRRYHDASGAGELTDPNSNHPKARVYYEAWWHDAVGRARNHAHYGTHGASALTRPATAPARSDTVLVTTNESNDRGELYKTIDPKGRDDRSEFDHAGRRVKTIENYVDGTPSGDTDRTTEFAYNPDGRLKALTAKNGTTGDQVTKYIYGTTLSDSQVASYDLLRAVIYPDSDDADNPLGNGSDGVYDRVEFKYNRLGEVIERKDQNETVRVFDYDLLGRLIHDRATALGTGVDVSVQRISRAYEVHGFLLTVTSYSSPTVGSGSVINEVKFEYNDFGQLAKEYQATAGSAYGSTPNVQYAYANGSENHIRRTGITYPSGKTIYYSYGWNHNDDDLLSRVTKITDSGSDRVQYNYLGVDRRVIVTYMQFGLELRYVKVSGESDGNAGDPYTGLDRFGRVCEVRWRSGGVERERVKYGFDRAGNRIWRENLVASSGQDEFYTYDGLYQLTNRDRGNLNV